jgi:signal peptidase I
MDPWREGHAARWRSAAAGCVLLGALVVAGCAPTTPVLILRVTPGPPDAASLAPVGAFAPTGWMTTPRLGHTATMLTDGRVLIAGGLPSAGSGPAKAMASAELYDPSTGSFDLTCPMSFARGRHTATSLADGRVFFVGGSKPDATADVYDPATCAFNAKGPLQVPRARATATLLRDGRVLVVGGDAPSKTPCPSPEPSAGGPTTVAELYLPSRGTFTPTGAIMSGLSGHAAALLGDGKVLIVGGSGSCGRVHGADLYDPTTGTFSPIGAPETPLVSATAVTLATGNVLVVGGAGDGGAAVQYAPDLRRFMPMGSMAHARTDGTAILLADGRVVFLGGSDAAGRAILEIEVFDPRVGSFQPASRLSTGRAGATATLLEDGRILVAGGGVGDKLAVATADLYEPVQPQVAGASPTSIPTRPPARTPRPTLSAADLTPACVGLGTTGRFMKNRLGSSVMAPLLLEGDVAMTDLSPGQLPYVAGDVVTLRTPSSVAQALGPVAIGRIVVAGPATVTIADGRVRVNGKTLAEPYVLGGGPTIATIDRDRWVLRANEVFVLHDNRQAVVGAGMYLDSRVYGPVPVSSIIGRVMYRCSPYDRRGRLPTYHPPARP